MPLTPAVAVGMGVGIVAYLKLPLSAIVIAATLTASGGIGAIPLIIVGVVVAHLATLALEGRFGADHNNTSQAGQTGAALTSSPPGSPVTPHDTQG